MQYRANFFFWMFVQAVYVFLHIYTIDIMYRFTNSILGWNKAEMLFLAGIFRVIEGTFHIVFHPNVLRIPQRVNDGKLDIYLTKPVNSLFMISTRYQGWDEISTVITGVILVMYSLLMLGKLNVYSLILSIIVCFLGEIATFSMMLVFASWSFFIEKMTSIKSLWEVASRTVRNPMEIYSHNKIVLEVILFPLTIIATLPAQIVLEKIPVVMLLIEVLLVSILFLGSYAFWKFALRHYSSASS